MDSMNTSIIIYRVDPGVLDILYMVLVIVVVYLVGSVFLAVIRYYLNKKYLNMLMRMRPELLASYVVDKVLEYAKENNLLVSCSGDNRYNEEKAILRKKFWETIDKSKIAVGLLLLLMVVGIILSLQH